MDNILQLPFEVLLELFSWLRPKDIISLSRTCRLFQNAATVDKLWAQVCFNEFGIKPNPSPNGFVRKFYKNVLHPYGQFLGYWTNEINERTQDIYGSLLQITYLDEKLCGIEHQVPKIPHLMEPLRPNTIFTISMDDTKDDRAVIQCQLHQHDCNLQYVEKVLDGKPSQSWYLMWQCSKAPLIGDMGQQEIEELRQQYIADHLDLNIEDAATDQSNLFFLGQKCVNVLKNSSEPQYFSRLQFPPACSFKVPIQPGIFKGTDGIKGIQLLVLSYENENTATGLKITGDFLVPAGEVSFKVDLRCCMYMDEESQSMERLLHPIEPVLPDDVLWTDLPNPQPFLIPQEWQHPLVPIAPNECLARFDGIYTSFIISGRGRVTRLVGQWIVFTEDLFGFLSFNPPLWTVFHRVQDPAFQATRKS